MYAGLWRILPGPWWVRVLIMLIMIAAIVWALFYVVFPIVGPMITPDDVTIE